MYLIFLLILLTLAGLAVYSKFERDLSGTRSRLAGRSQTIDTSFGRMEYAMIGEGDPTLIIHGAGGGFDQAIDSGGALAGADTGSSPRLALAISVAVAPDPIPRCRPTPTQSFLIILRSVGAVRHRHLRRRLVGDAIRNPSSATVPGVGSSRPGRLLAGADAQPWRCPVQGDHRLRFRRLGRPKFMWLVPCAMAKAMLGTDPLIVCTAEQNEKARVREVLDHLLPVSSRIRGMEFDIKTAAATDPYPIERILCPVLTVSAEDDLFGTAARARQIAAIAPNGRAVIYPTGGHALVGRYSEALSEIASFLSEGSGAALRKGS